MRSIHGLFQRKQILTNIHLRTIRYMELNNLSGDDIYTDPRTGEQDPEYPDYKFTQVLCLISGELEGINFALTGKEPIHPVKYEDPLRRPRICQTCASWKNQNSKECSMIKKGVELGYCKKISEIVESGHSIETKFKKGVAKTRLGIFGNVIYVPADFSCINHKFKGQ